MDFWEASSRLQGTWDSLGEMPIWTVEPGGEGGAGMTSPWTSGEQVSVREDVQAPPVRVLQALPRPKCLLISEPRT